MKGERKGKEKKRKKRNGRSQARKQDIWFFLERSLIFCLPFSFSSCFLTFRYHNRLFYFSSPPKEKAQITFINFHFVLASPYSLFLPQDSQTFPFSPIIEEGGVPSVFVVSSYFLLFWVNAGRRGKKEEKGKDAKRAPTSGEGRGEGGGAKKTEEEIQEKNENTGYIFNTPESVTNILLGFVLPDCFDPP